MPRDLYVKRTFRDATAVKQYLDRGMKAIFDGKLYVEPIEDHLPTESEPWISGKFLKENERFVDVQVGDRVVVGLEADVAAARLFWTRIAGRWQAG